MSFESVLAKTGLPENAIRVYLACLQLGQATISEIARAAETKRPTTYLVMDDLLMRGYASSVRKGSKKYYYAEHPSRILQLLKFKVREVERLLPELEAIYNEPKHKPKIKIYEGKESVKGIYDELYAHLGKKEEALFFTSVGDLQKYFPEAITYYVNHLQKQKNYCIRELNLGDEQGIMYAKKIKPTLGKNHKIRLLDPSLKFGNTDNLIFGNKLVIFSIRQDIFAIVIENKDIAETYRALFNGAWETGKEI